MFPLPPNNDPQNHDDTLILDDLLLHDLTDQQDCLQGNYINFATTSTEGPRRTGPVRVPVNTIKRNDDMRKYVHRDIEKQRRQEMANLCGSLRTLVPLHSTKGKHSMSDGIEEAVNHIKDMQNNIEKLKARRDTLRRKSGNSITVNPSHDGVEILINTSFEEEQGGICLSRVLAQLVHSGFNVLSCVSTRADAGLLHRIQASNPTFNDLSGLRERLAYLIQH